MTVSNVVSPLMSSLDRFVVGAVLSMTAVAYYATAYEAVCPAARPRSCMPPA